MSGKIVQLRTARTAPTPELVAAMPVFYGLRSLWISGSLSQDAFILGCQATAKMATQDTRDCVMVPEDAFTTTIMVNNRVFLGPMRPMINELLTWIQAAQNLHFMGGVMSHFDQNCLDEEDAGERHFTRSVERGANSRWSMSGPIFYRLPMMTKDEFDEECRIRVSEGLAHTKTRIELTVA